MNCRGAHETQDSNKSTSCISIFAGGSGSPSEIAKFAVVSLLSTIRSVSKS
jgi:hypothetical protein